MKRKAEEPCHTPGRGGGKRANINSLMYTPKKKIDLIVQDSLDHFSSPGKGAGSRQASKATFSSKMDAEILGDMSKREIGRQETSMEFENVECTCGPLAYPARSPLARPSHAHAPSAALLPCSLLP